MINDEDTIKELIKQLTLMLWNSSQRVLSSDRKRNQ